jgi:hypothetical protein
VRPLPRHPAAPPRPWPHHHMHVRTTCIVARPSTRSSAEASIRLPHEPMASLPTKSGRVAPSCRRPLTRRCQHGLKVVDPTSLRHRATSLPQTSSACPSTPPREREPPPIPFGYKGPTSAWRLALGAPGVRHGGGCEVTLACLFMIQSVIINNSEII